MRGRPGEGVRGGAAPSAFGGTVRALLDGVASMVTVSDRDGRIVYANAATQSVSGYSPEEFAGLDPFDSMHPEDRPRCEEAFERLAKTPSLSLELEHRVRRKDGEWRWVEATFTSLFDDPAVAGLVATVRDVTERKDAEAALTESEERLRLAAEAAGLGHWEFVPETGELHGDGAFNAHHGAPPGVHLGFEGFLHAVHPDGRGAVRRRLAAALEGRDGYGAQYRVVLPDGAIRWVYSRGRFVEGAGSAPDRLVGVALDVTARRELEGERERARAHELAARAEEAERGRISRELHDRVAHDMVVAHQSLQLHAAYAPSDPPRAAAKLEQAAEATKAALDQTRDLSAQLARSDARETRHGLGAALRDLLAAHAPPGVETTLSVAGDESSVPTKVGEQAYLVMREAVRNAVAHSGCSRIGVSLEIRDGELVGRVEDDGAGFDQRGDPDGRRGDVRPAAADGEGAPRAGVGLGSMRERTELLGGRLDIHSEPWRGTAVEVRAPLEG